jgi:hypothetical protein
LPKRAWTQYYAGYSERFAYHTLRNLALGPDDLVLDCWNGSGTTTSVAFQLGLRAIGIDINPVMAVVATARNAQSLDASMARSKMQRIREAVRSTYQFSAEDGLQGWFTPETSTVFRQISDAIRGGQNLFSDYGGSSPRNALLFLALFSTAKEAASIFRTTNPTWTRIPKAEERVSLSKDRIVERFQETALDYLREIERAATTEHPDTSRPTIYVASSDYLPVPDGSVSAILTSPPYCTRIDYAVATRIEYSILGFPLNRDFRVMRESMLGTPTVKNGSTSLPVHESRWGATCMQVLNSVRDHPSKASSTYYLKNLLQYFHQLFISLSEIARVLACDGSLTLVVQDSYYKEVHIDLATIIEQMTHTLGMRLQARQDFPSRLTMRWVNSRSRRYRSGGDSVESVLRFERC